MKPQSLLTQIHKFLSHPINKGDFRMKKATPLTVIGSVAIVGLIASNVMLYTKVTDLEKSVVTKDAIAATADSVMNLESRMVKLEQLEPTTEGFKNYIMENPDDLVKSLAKYRFEQEQKSKAQESDKLKSSLGEIYNDPNDTYFGNPNGKHVLVEFIDYNCGYCKRLAPKLEQFVALDPEAKVIVKQFPIFQNQPTSAYSSLMGSALSYYKPELFHAYHKALITSPKITKESIEQALVNVGVSKDDLQPYLDKAKAQIEKVRGLGARLQVTGTPTVFAANGERSHGNFDVNDLIASYE